MKNKYFRERLGIVCIILISLINIIYVCFTKQVESISFDIVIIVYEFISYIIVILLVIKIQNEKKGIDNLTKAFTKEKLYNDLKKKVKASDNFKVVYVDIDDFKKVNDTKGHLEGDRLLVEFVKVLKLFVKANIYRYGGDEFVIITKEENSKLQEMIKQVKLRGFKFSYGISSFVESFDENLAKKSVKNSKEFDIELLIENILKLADDRMYENKEEKEDRLEN